MRNLKNAVAITVLLILTLLVSKYDFHLIPYVILGLFLVHLSMRKMSWARSYFTSKYNILTSKSHYEKDYDFSTDILFHKLIEVLENSGFKIVRTNEQKGEIFATSSISWFSWGENLFIDILQKGADSTMKLTSAGFFQLSYSFGKNEANFNKLISKFEESLTI